MKEKPNLQDVVSISRELKSLNKINDSFEIMLDGLTLEELLGLKLELAAKRMNGKLYGFKIWRALPEVVRIAAWRTAISLARTTHETVDFLGLERSHYYELKNKYGFDKFFSESP